MLLRMMTPEVLSLARAAEEGTFTNSLSELTEEERANHAKEYRRIMKIPLEAREALQKELEFRLGETYEDLYERMLRCFLQRGEK